MSKEETFMDKGILFAEEPMVINKALARLIGLNEAIVLQQVHYWIKHNRKSDLSGNSKILHFYDDRYWAFNSIPEWQKSDFDFWSCETIKRTFAKLVKLGLIIIGNYNKEKWDKTYWYTIDYEKLSGYVDMNTTKVISNPVICTSGQNDLIEDVKMTSSKVSKRPDASEQKDLIQKVKMTQPIPETTTKTNLVVVVDASETIDKYAIVKKEFEENICKLKPSTLKKFKEYSQTVELEFLVAVIDYCAEINIESYAGFKTVIDNFMTKDITNPTALENYINSFRKNKEKIRELELKKREARAKENSNKSSSPKTNFNDYEQRSYDYDVLEKKLLGFEK